MGYVRRIFVSKRKKKKREKKKKEGKCKQIKAKGGDKKGDGEKHRKESKKIKKQPYIFGTWLLILTKRPN